VANITRYNPFEDFFFKAFPAESDLQMMIDVKGAKAEYKDGVLNLTLPKKGNGAAKHIAVS